MDSNPQVQPGSVKMRANRKVIEARCGICGSGFALGEEMYACPACGGYHHTVCLESAGQCPLPANTPAVAAEAPAPPEAASAPPPAPELSAEESQRRQRLAETYAQWSTPELEAALDSERRQTGAPRWSGVGTGAGMGPYSPRRRSAYTGGSRWSGAGAGLYSTQGRAAGAGTGGGDPVEIEVIAEELKRRRLSEPWTCPECGAANPAGSQECANQASHEAEPPQPPPSAGRSAPPGPDERRCPVCAETIKREALKCRFCGQALSGEVFGGGAALGMPLTPEWLQFHLDEIENSASKGMWFSIVGIFCCFGVVCSPLGIYYSNRAISLLDEHPECEGRTSARGKARAGQIIGWIIVGCYAIGILRMLANVH